MQFILFLLLLFTIGCVLYGISAGVQGVQRGAIWLANSKRSDNCNEDTTAQSQSTQQANATARKAQATNTSHGIEELQTLFALHQQGALTSEEFQDMKQHLLHALHSTSNKH